MHLKITGHGHVGLTANPGHRSPTVTARGINFAQRGRDYLDLRVLLYNSIDHTEEGAGVELGGGRDLWSGDAESFLQVLFVSHEYIDILHDAPNNFDRAILAA